MTPYNRRVLTCVVLWAAVVVFAASLWRQPLLLAAIYVAGSAVLLTAWRSRRGRFIYAWGFVLGPGGEIVAVHQGAWQYADAPWLIPLWLPPAWGLTALILFELVNNLPSRSA